jgi:E3 ubiquitin-protein ligase UBR7
MINVCELFAKDTVIGNDNVYNHNYEGLYCWCEKEYKGEEIEGDMFQCLDCQDWFHDLCLLNKPARFGSFVCKECVVKHPFLQSYKEYPEFVFLNHDETASEPPSKKQRTELKVTLHTGCRLTSHVEPQNLLENHNLFLSGEWRNLLCQCEKCADLHTSLPFLDLEEDYEIDDNQSVVSLEEAGMNELAKMGREKAIEGVHAYNDLKEGLMEFLKDFARDGRVVEKADIDGFFERKTEERRRGK